MPRPQREPRVADKAPSGEVLTPHDNDHLVTYLRLLDAAAEGADWMEVARIVLGMDPEREPERARARWLTEHGYRRLVRGDDPHRFNSGVHESVERPLLAHSHKS